MHGCQPCRCCCCCCSYKTCCDALPAALAAATIVSATAVAGADGLIEAVVAAVLTDVEADPEGRRD